MAAPQVGVFLQSVTWGSLSLDANAGGIQSIDFSKAGEPLAHWSGDDILPRFQSFVRQLCDITISTDDVSPDIVEGEMNDLVFIIKMGDLTTLRTVTAVNMKLVSITLSQSEASAGTYRLRWVHESADGVTDPITVS